MFQSGSESRHSRRVRWLGVAIAVLSLGLPSMVIAPSEVSAQRVRKKYKDKVAVPQPKPVLQKGRFELAPRFGISVNDPVNRTFKVGLNFNYHLTERIGLGLVFDWMDFGGALGGPTNLFEEVFNETQTSVDAAVVNFYGGLDVSFVPLFGKFALFNSAIIYYDLGLSLGAGAVNAESLALPTATTGLGVSWAVSARVFLAKWLAVNVEFRDVMFGATLSSGSGVFTNMMTIAGGLSFYLPTSFQYSDPALNEDLEKSSEE